jgi:hydroxymethylpyrimidine pyrophosphatase-like HAD family hydrolase
MARRLDPHGWHVFHAGGAVVNVDDMVVTGHGFSEDQIIDGLELASDNEWIIEFYTATDYAVDSDDPLAIRHAELMGVKFERRHRASLLEEQHIVRMQFVVPVADARDVVAISTRKGLTATAATSPIMTDAAFVSLTLPGVTKATGIAAIATQLGITLDEVMMVGDGLNDLPAIQAVGHPVAMGNAEPEVLDAAHHVVGHVDDDGLVDALELSLRL